MYKAMVFLIVLLCLLTGCKSKEKAKPKKVIKDASKFMFSGTKGIAAAAYIDSLPIYAEIDVKPYSLDSLIAEVTIINNWNKSLWLYKPLLPADSMIEECFYVRDEESNSNLIKLIKTSNHKYVSGSQELLPNIIPELSDSILFECKAGSHNKFYTNLAKHYNFRQLIDGKRIKNILVNYGVDFPYIENGEHQYYTEEIIPGGDSVRRPVYFDVRIKESQKPGKKFDEGGLLKLRLPVK